MGWSKLILSVRIITSPLCLQAPWLIPIVDSFILLLEASPLASSLRPILVCHICQAKGIWNMCLETLRPATPHLTRFPIKQQRELMVQIASSLGNKNWSGAMYIMCQNPWGVRQAVTIDVYEDA